MVFFLVGKRVLGRKDLFFSAFLEMADFLTVVLKTLESPLDCKEIQSVRSKGDQSWVFTGRTMLKLKLQYFGHLMQRADSFDKTLMLG